MNQQIQGLLETLSPVEQLAAEILKTALDCYNSKDGTGMFSGVDRYQKLAGRAEIAAVQARKPLDFWSLLLRRMLWPAPPARMDETILALLQQPNATAAINQIASNTAALVMIARFWHTLDKKQRIAEQTGADKNEEGGLFDNEQTLFSNLEGN